MGYHTYFIFESFFFLEIVVKNLKENKTFHFDDKIGEVVYRVKIVKYDFDSLYFSISQKHI